MRKTKIVCTIGPASDNEETFAAMCRAGLNVARLNFSHGTHEEHQKKIDMIKKVREKLGLPIAIMLDAISHATCGMAVDIGAKAIVVSSLSGATVRMVSRFRVPTDIIGMATNKAVWYKLALSWGVLPVLNERFESTDVLFYHARKAAVRALNLQPGDNIVMTGGMINGTSGNTNLIKVDTI